MSSSLCKEGRDGLEREVGGGVQITETRHRTQDGGGGSRDPRTPKKRRSEEAVARSVIWQTQTAPGLRQSLRNQLDCSSQESAASA